MKNIVNGLKEQKVIESIVTFGIASCCSDFHSSWETN